MLNSKPIIAITMGDPAGIGPEITIKALQKDNIYETCRPIVIGDASIIERVMQIPNMPKLKINIIKAPEEAKYERGIVNVIDLNCIEHIETFKQGVISMEAGSAAFRYVRKAIQLAMEKKVDATVTNAINKEAINLAGYHYSGHTEIYAEFTGTKQYTMMLAYENVRVVHISTHVSLREACNRVKKGRVLEVIRIANQACKDLGMETPRIAVAGLNPHSGENGMFGTEEIDEIIPAIKEAKEEGIIVEGPISPDTVFSKCRGGWYDIVVAMYHDQGHIPLKVLGFVYNKEEQKWDAVAGVNITLGLPIIRTSVDHGTAFDQVGTGKANEVSLLNAIDYAIQLAKKETRIHTTNNLIKYGEREEIA